MKSRNLVPEKMDDPNLNPAEHRQALNGLRRVNIISRTSVVVARQIKSFCEALQLSSARVLDVGCGSGDVAYGVAKTLPANGQWHIEGWDISSTAIEYAKQLHQSSTALDALSKRNLRASLSFHAQDIYSSTSEPFDFVYCSLFLHHFSEQDATRLLKRMRELSRVAIIVDDLDRTRFGYWMAKVGVNLLSRSPVVHFDGPQSVRAAFSMTEIQALARDVGLDRISLKRRWPARWLLAAELSS
ncbi:MAG: methyltransferase domain-containing protein [Pirellulaceae bacterium]|nr:methyltransferase domain-containing protein [Pirellulaceae bacterium]